MLVSYKIDKWTATTIVIANMVGTGVFTSLGFQLLSIQNAWSIILLWLIGGIIALCGAFTYAEIGSYLIRNGGEYHYLSKLFHPSLGFIAGFISVIVGFAAPIAAASVAFGKYLAYSLTISRGVSVSPSTTSLFLLLLIASVHLFGIKTGGLFQKYITLLKIIIMITFVGAFLKPPLNTDVFQYQPYLILSELFSPAFAISLIYVSYAYSGWNAAAYVAGEIDNPQKNLSKSIITGTLVVLFFYVLLNVCFLYSTPVSELKGKVEVGVISAHYIFGNTFGNIIGFLISILLISTISSMFIAAPRVLCSMGEDYPLFSFLSKRNKYQSPYMALIFITFIAFILIISSSFEWLINFIGITLIIFTILTAFSIFLLRKRKNYQPAYSTPLYPLPPLFFIAMNIWILIYVLQNNFSAFIASIACIFIAFILYKIILYFQ